MFRGKIESFVERFHVAIYDTQIRELFRFDWNFSSKWREASSSRRGSGRIHGGTKEREPVIKPAKKGPPRAVLHEPGGYLRSVQQEERDFRYPVCSDDLRAPVLLGGGENRGTDPPRQRGGATGELVLRGRGTVRVSIALQRCGGYIVCSR